MKHFALLLLTFLSSTIAVDAQTIISMPVAQNPVFGISTNHVETMMPTDGMILGADLLVTGGSGTYTYLWTDVSGNTLGAESTLHITAPGTYRLTISDTCDCQLYADFIVQSTGIEEILAGNNPNIRIHKRQLYLSDTLSAKQMTIVSVSGKMEMLVNNPAEKIDLSHMPKGTFIVSLLTSEGKLIAKKIQLH